MHKQILSEKEEEMIEQFLKGNQTPETFRMLKLRIKKNYKRLNHDFNLIEKAYKKFSIANI